MFVIIFDDNELKYQQKTKEFENMLRLMHHVEICYIFQKLNIRCNYDYTFALILL